MVPRHTERVGDAEATLAFPIGGLEAVAGLDREQNLMRVARSLETGEASLPVVKGVLRAGLQHGGSTMTPEYVIERIGFLPALRLAYRAILPALLGPDAGNADGAEAGDQAAKNAS